MEYKSNTSYIFIPFSFSDSSAFQSLNDGFINSPSWHQVHDEILYMLKFVADKLNSEDRKNCRCYHYMLNDEARESMGLAPRECWYQTSEHEFMGSRVRFGFQITSVQLFCFSTSVGIMAYQVHFESDDPYWISSAQYCLKKVSRETISVADTQTPPETLLYISKKVVAEFETAGDFQFFFYSNPTTERANILSYLEVPPKDEYRKELFFLRRCYNDAFMYTPNEELDKEEIYAPSPCTVWGISPEAAVCLACPELGSAKFIHETFYRNFNAQYLFMYVLLLHQKYVLYMFLTKIGIGMYNDIDTLEGYRNQLYEFQTDFVFSCVTEVPQYQNLYERVADSFALKKMYADVQEPLLSLGDVRRAASDNSAKKRENAVNKVLFILSVLSFFSALVDSFDFADSFFGWFLNDTGVKVVQIACIVGIVSIVFVLLLSLLASRRLNKKPPKHN